MSDLFGTVVGIKSIEFHHWDKPELAVADGSLLIHYESGYENRPSSVQLAATVLEMADRIAALTAELDAAKQREVELTKIIVDAVAEGVYTENNLHWNRMSEIWRQEKARAALDASKGE